ncbi:MAG: hypothetical protein WBC85_13405 [Planktotalea sp.]|uniref:hypothetical protein n=1 Tax=Planktotalea sp. TaxID=2029877 RepID=UPI003C7140EC
MKRVELDNPDLDLETLFRRFPRLAPAFLSRDMLCVGCMVAPFHTLTDACAEYGLSQEQFLEELARLLD